jgi:hypothetical protein
LKAQAKRSTSVNPVCISIGRVPISLFIPQQRLRESAFARYREFAEKSAKALPVYLGDAKEKAAQLCRFSHQLDGASVLLGDRSAGFVGVRHEYALDSLLRILLTVMLVPRRGFLLHAASVVRDGKAHVFMGRSGAGKSTVASLSPQGSVLTDEISLLRYRDGAWRAHGTPFWGEFRAAGMNCDFPIAGIYWLTQDREDRAEPLSAKEMLRATLPCVLFFTRESHANQALLQILLGLVQQVPCYRLRFRRAPDFWSVIP